MTALTEKADLQHLTEKASSMALVMDARVMESAHSIAKVMADSKVTVPKHLQGNAGDCMAIVLQAMNWGMNPFVVAQKTHVVNGTLGYEAQLVNAVVQSQGFIKGSFTYEYEGEGNSLKCRVGAILKNEKRTTFGEWLGIAEVQVKNSPLWKTNPKQQIGYLQVKNWARAYCPAAILGVYTKDELETSNDDEKDVTPKKEQSNEVEYLSDNEFHANETKWMKSFNAGVKKGSTVDDFYAWVEAKGKLLTDEQKEVINGWLPIEGESKKVDDDFVNAMEEEEGKENADD